MAVENPLKVPPNRRFIMKDIWTGCVYVTRRSTPINHTCILMFVYKSPLLDRTCFFDTHEKMSWYLNTFGTSVSPNNLGTVMCLLQILEFTYIRVVFGLKHVSKYTMHIHTLIVWLHVSWPVQVLKEVLIEVQGPDFWSCGDVLFAHVHGTLNNQFFNGCLMKHPFSN